ALALALILALNAEAVGEAVLLLTMFTPLVAVAAVKLFVTRDAWSLAGWKELGLHRPGFRLWPAAVLLPFAVLLPGYLIVWATGLGQFSGFLAPEAITQAAVKFVVSLLIGAMLGALGEETGWRGFLLPRLLHLGPMRASLIVGFLHGVWHLPLILLTPFYHAGGDWWIAVPLFLAALTLGGAVYGWLRLASASIWPAALAHRALNLMWDRFDAATATERPVAVDYLAGETGFVTILGLLVLTLLIARAWRSQSPPAGG
ncbi:MAG: CPBP family intramembrane glutamic endopeptidase, partial [Oricola sp.]